MNNPRFIVIFLIVGCFSCKESLRQLSSKDFISKKVRVEILKKEIISKSEFQDAEFELFNVNGFSDGWTMISGASYWDYKFVVKVNQADIDKWTAEMLKVELENYDISWTTTIIEKRKTEWIINSIPEFYTRKNSDVTLLVYRAEGIIFKRVIQD
jgi:hypothetical protein